MSLSNRWRTGAANERQECGAIVDLMTIMHFASTKYTTLGDQHLEGLEMGDSGTSAGILVTRNAFTM